MEPTTMPTAEPNLTPLESKALALLKEHTAAWGNHAVAEDIADHPHLCINKRQASAALVSLAKKGVINRSRGRKGSWFGSVYSLPSA